MLSGYLNNSVKNINHTLNDFLNEITTEYNGEFSARVQELITSGNNPENYTGTSCISKIDILKLIPTWVLAEKSSRESAGEANVISVFDFLQKYYDWLYCDLSEGSGYYLGENLLDLVDIQRTREEFLKRIYDVYFKSFPFESVNTDPNIVFDLQKAKEFMLDIKRNLHRRKTNLESINYFFTKLFNVQESDIFVYLPKTDIIRLNGGMFNNDYFNFISATGDYENINILGSGLNISRFQDNDWFHDWSYLIYIDSIQENQTIKDAYVKSLHPSGLRLVFGKQLTDYQGPGAADDTNLVCEYPMLKNYAPYGLTVTYGEIGVLNGITLYGLSGCSGCDGSYKFPAATGFTGPVYVLPTWTGLIDEKRFFDINIISFLQLCYSSDLTSPNENKSCTNC